MLKVPCEVYSRVCGFYRPVNQFNLGKQEEYKERKTFNVDKALKILDGENTNEIDKKKN